MVKSPFLMQEDEWDGMDWGRGFNCAHFGCRVVQRKQFTDISRLPMPLPPSPSPMEHGVLGLEMCLVGMDMKVLQGSRLDLGC